jgi:hypothetical protein
VTHDERIANTARAFLQIVQREGWWLTHDNRIGLEDVAKLLGIAPGTLRNRIAAGAGPRVYPLGGRGHRASVRILDLAEWIESLPVTARNVM